MPLVLKIQIKCALILKIRNLFSNSKIKKFWCKVKKGGMDRKNVDA